MLKGKGSVNIARTLATILAANAFDLASECIRSLAFDTYMHTWNSSVHFWKCICPFTPFVNGINYAKFVIKYIRNDEGKMSGAIEFDVHCAMCFLNCSSLPPSISFSSIKYAALDSAAIRIAARSRRSRRCVLFHTHACNLPTNIESNWIETYIWELSI